MDAAATWADLNRHLPAALAAAVPTPALSGGICLGSHELAPAALRDQVTPLLAPHGLAPHVQWQPDAAGGTAGWRLELTAESAARWTPSGCTLELASRLAADAQQGLLPPPEDAHAALEREVWVSLLASPRPLRFASAAELASSVRVRRHIAQAGAATALAFKTEAAERPAAYWHYDEVHGFLLHPHSDLIEALLHATQPAVSGRLYDFSCYRATEYVILLGIALEARAHQPQFYAQLQHQCRVHAIRSAQFHDVFLTEFGSLEDPLPAGYYVPGDRLWFRNPDTHSADVTGFEGSWVVYLGGGLFSNFWTQNAPFSLLSKALEIYHWRDGVVTDAAGELQMDETVVEAKVAQTLSKPDELRRVAARMLRLRDPKGVYAEGGCIDATREAPRPLAAGPQGIHLPDAAA